MVETVLARRMAEIHRHRRAIQKIEQSGFRVITGSGRNVRRDWQEWIVTAKGMTFLLLYNCIEATVRDEMQNFYSAISSHNCGARDISQNLLETWIEHRYQHAAKKTATLETFRMTGQKLVLESVSNEPIELNVLGLGIGGNFDDRRIREICDKHDIRFPFRGPQVSGHELQTIRVHRNSLAHGFKTFEEVGREYTASQLEAIISQTDMFLRAFSASVRHAGRHRHFQKPECRKKNQKLPPSS